MIRADREQSSFAGRISLKYIADRKDRIKLIEMSQTAHLEVTRISDTETVTELTARRDSAQLVLPRGRRITFGQVGLFMSFINEGNETLEILEYATLEGGL